MTLLTILLSVYIFAINFYSFRLLKVQKDEFEAGGAANARDGKLILSAILGGAAAIYVSMFCMRFRLENLLLMVLMPVMAVLNVYCFYWGFRSIWLFL